MGDTALTTAVATVIATIITGAVMLVTQRSAAKAAVRNQSVASRTDMEKEAFTRAEQFYEKRFNASQAEIERQEGDIDELRQENRGLKDEVKGLTDRVKMLERAREADESRHLLEMRRVREELDTAKEALRLRFPDEK